MRPVSHVREYTHSTEKLIKIFLIPIRKDLRNNSICTRLVKTCEDPRFVYFIKYDDNAIV